MKKKYKEKKKYINYLILLLIIIAVTVILILLKRDVVHPSEPEGLEYGTVEFVIDGDTFVFKNKEGIESRIRMIGIDAPESASHIESQNTEAGRLATEFVKSHLEGKRVGLEYDVQTTDRYGRTLAYVWLDGELFNKRVLEEGHAELLIIPPNEKYSDYLEDLSSN